jgi:hypothetical protein
MLYYKTKWQEEVVRLNVRVQEKFVEFHRNGNLEKLRKAEEAERLEELDVKE